MNKLKQMSVPELITRFVEIAMQQDNAAFEFDHKRYNKLYDKMDDIDNELRARGPAARRALMPLYEHPNLQVQIKAAKRTLAVAPVEARAVLERIRASGEMPQALDAGMSIRGLDDGTYKPT
jgi:hypothetical protein